MVLKKKYVNKDIKLRQKNKYIEDYTFIYNIIVNNSNFKNSTRLKSKSNLFKFARFNSYNSNFVNRCILTGKSRCINRAFKISRNKLLSLSKNAFITDLNKHTK